MGKRKEKTFVISGNRSVFFMGYHRAAEKYGRFFGEKMTLQRDFLADIIIPDSKKAFRL